MLNVTSNIVFLFSKFSAMKNNLALTAILGILTVILGAFGSHVFAKTLSPEALKSFETGITYQLFHIPVLLFINSYSTFSNKTKRNASLFFFLGILFFSGSIYLITLTQVSAKRIWFITPLGGLLLISGWTYLLIKFLKK